ncbi:MAG: hypothetical protein K6F25_01890 [Bacteroidales bacterium]|nr:hypothetical protein [Bacteroidales bacterium]
MHYVEVILPLKLGWTPVYSAPEGTPVGRRVRVMFARREYIGVVSAVGVTPDVAAEKVQEVLEVVDGLADVTPEEIRFWKFIASYYLCSVGEVFKAAYPAGKVRSEKIAADAVEKASQTARRTAEAVVATWTKRLEKLRYRLKKKEEAIPAKKEGSKIRSLLEEDRARIIDAIHNAEAALEAAVEQVALLDAKAPADGKRAGADASLPRRKAPGKPEVLIGTGRGVCYAEAARSALKEGFQVLVLAPEKAFCDRLETEFRELLPAGIPQLFTSDISTARRRKTADAVRSGEARLIIGTRAALWLPFRRLGLIIIDEEQDTFYKQTEPAPRYHGRDAAVALAGIHSARVMLGSACPSLETVLNVISGKYDASCPIPDAAARTCGSPMVVDISKERRKNGMVGAFSRVLIRAIGGDFGDETPGESGKVVLIRGWEKPDELQAQVAELFHGRDDIVVMTMQELKREGTGGAGLIAVMQADAMVSRDDFRADERALQLVTGLSALAPRVIIQTAVGERFSSTRSTEDLMAERKQFGFPPYTRMVDITIGDANARRLALMAGELAGTLGGRKQLLQTRPSAVQVAEDTMKIRLVLPRNASLAAKKAEIYRTVCEFEQARKYQGHIILDVDPQ